jgi:hypothetical protein
MVPALLHRGGCIFFHKTIADIFITAQIIIPQQFFIKVKGTF